MSLSPVPCLGPGGVHVELWSVHHSAKLGQQSEHPGRLNVPRQLSLQLVRSLHTVVQSCVEPGAYHWHEVIDRLCSLAVGQQIHDQIAEIVAVVCGHQLHALLQVLSLYCDETIAR